MQKDLVYAKDLGLIALDQHAELANDESVGKAVTALRVQVEIFERVLASTLK